MNDLLRKGSNTGSARSHVGRSQRLYPAAVFVLASVPALVGVVVGYDHFRPSSSELPRHRDFEARLANWDGAAYRQIAEEGYSYASGNPSNVAFFPVFPLLGLALKACFGLRAATALVIVANACLICCFVLLFSYVRREGCSESVSADFTLLALGLWPTTVFFHLAYSESLFLLLTILAMFGMQRNWRPEWIALLIGLATGARFVGVALIPVFWWRLWNSSKSRAGFWLSVAPLTLISLSGLLAYMAYQHFAFGDALAFAKTQADWGKQPMSLAEFGNLLIGKPLWATYVPGNPVYWLEHDNVYVNPIFSLNFANPLYWLFAWFLLILGACRKWLTRYEVLLGMGLLLIPYLTVASMSGMRSHGRYAAVVFPCYLVMGKLLAALDPATRTLVCCASAILLFLYAAMFVAQYAIY